MKSIFFAATLLLVFSLKAQAPVAVPIPQEPHHHLVLENDYVRVFRVSVPAHESTLLHQHDVPYLYVSLGPADVINAVQGKPEAHLVMADGQLGYSPGHFAHIARNDSNLDFNNVTIELLHPQGEPRNLCAQVAVGASVGPCQETVAKEVAGMTTLRQFETTEMIADLVRLSPNPEMSVMVPQNPSLVVALDGGQIEIVPHGKSAKTLTSGELIWLDESSVVTVRNLSKKLSSYLQLSFRDNPGGTKP